MHCQATEHVGGPVSSGLATRLRCRTKGKDHDSVPGAITYEDIGGLHRQVQCIREMIELPLKYPEVFQHLGVEAPKGVRLWGPPCAGKSLIARAVTQEANVHFLHLNGPEIIDKMYGASKAQIRKMLR
ncbi:MAG: cell division control protein 48 [Rhodospirillaceae bacterium]|nr:MAG: cell division control protein 48 [Rhodospirillaceae bacterium]